MIYVININSILLLIKPIICMTLYCMHLHTHTHTRLSSLCEELLDRASQTHTPGPILLQIVLKAAPERRLYGRV